MQDSPSLSDSTEDEEEGASPCDGSGAGGGSCSSSRRSGGDGGDGAEGSVGVGAGEGGETVQHFPLVRPKSLMQKLQCSFQLSWLKDFPWLRYSKDTGLMFCGWCQKTPEDGGSVDLPQVGHDELSRGTRNYSNYRKTLLLRHHVSTEHKLYKANAQESEIPSEEGYCDFNSRPNENSLLSTSSTTR
ncbi:zinc finger protein and BTB domain-containing protein 10 isoform X1 [Sigmodon hispidus]